MKMFIHKYIIHISLIICFSCFNSFSQINPDTTSNNFLPLRTGNQWQYVKHVTDGGNVETYSLRYASIEVDTLIGNQVYYYYTSDWLYNTDWIFYSDTAQSIYIFWEDTNRVFMDFTLPVGSTFQQFVIGRHIYNDAEIVENNLGIGYYRFQPIAARHFQEIYASNLGPIQYREWSYQGFNIFIEYELIQATLTTVNGDTLLYTSHYKPIFSINPILTINSLDFEFEFYVYHEYSVFFPPGYPGGLNFIDSVWMYRYYSNGDSIIYVTDFLPYNDPLHPNPKYSVNFQIDTTLMKNGFNFYYRFLAKDKGIIPEYTSSPDSGYYECIWDDLSSLEEEADQLITYHLSQNYPNPFNPITSLQYAIGSTQFVTLKVYDMLGREVATLVNEEKPGGTYKVEFDGSNLASGIYLYKLSTDKFSETKLMSLIK